MLKMRARAPALQRKTGPARARRILLIDPDPAGREIGTLLMRYFGYEVQAAATYHEGMHLARVTQPTAVVSELVEDRAGERTIVEELGSHPATIGIPVLVLTSHVLPEDRERAAASGAVCFLAKPCDGQHLRRVLAETVGDPRG